MSGARRVRFRANFWPRSPGPFRPVYCDCWRTARKAAPHPRVTKRRAKTSDRPCSGAPANSHRVLRRPLPRGYVVFRGLFANRSPAICRPIGPTKHVARRLSRFYRVSDVYLQTRTNDLNTHSVCKINTRKSLGVFFFFRPKVILMYSF